MGTLLNFQSFKKCIANESNSCIRNSIYSLLQLFRLTLTYKLQHKYCSPNFSHITRRPTVSVSRIFPFACTFLGCDFRRKSKCEILQHKECHVTCKTQLKCKLCSNSYVTLILLIYLTIWNHWAFTPTIRWGQLAANRLSSLNDGCG